jgi:transcriptional regulator with XRE-family HTH domain
MVKVLKAKAERRKRGWSQQLEGVYANVSAADVSRIETGRMVPYPGQAERLARVLGLRPEELQEPAEEQEVQPA